MAIIVDLISLRINQRIEAIHGFARWALYGLILLLLAWIFSLSLRIIIKTLTHGRYAVEAFILNEKNDLLLYWHPHHKLQLPPGGRVGRFEFPHEAIVRHLKERLDLERDAYDFVPEFHHGLDGSKGHLGHVERVPAPFMVQRELRRQRSLVKFHYDFIYVLRLKNPHFIFPSNEYAPIHFVTRQDLINVVKDQECPPDVLNAYEIILGKVQG